MKGLGLALTVVRQGVVAYLLSGFVSSGPNSARIFF